MRQDKPSIRIAGNTAGPVLLALQAKGYAISLSYDQRAGGELISDFTAERDGRRFSATNPEELLGLVAMWETHGDTWHVERGGRDLYNALLAAALVHDGDGDVVEA